MTSQQETASVPEETGEPHSVAPPTPTPTPRPVPDTLDPGLVVRQRPHPDIEWVEVQGEVVAWHTGAESLHLLDPVAALVFQLADGTSSLGRTVEEIAEGHDQPASVVEDPVLSAAARLVELDLVEVLR